MQITVTDLDGVLDDIVLGDDDAGDYIVDPAPLPAERRAAQVEQLALGERVFATGRGNRQSSFSWVVQRDHGSKAAAAAYAFGHAAAVPINCGITVVNGVTTVVYSSAVIAAVDCVECAGQSTKFRYSVQGATP